MSYAEAAVFYDISPTTIQKWKKRIHSKPNWDIKPYKIEDEALAQDAKDYPDDYHYEWAQRFNCSPTGISKALKRIGISKKKTLEHPKACPVKRATYLAKLSHYIAQGFAITYIDESGFESETMLPCGYAPIDSPCIGSYNWQAKDRTNVIGASSRWYQSLRENMSSSRIMQASISAFKSYLTGMVTGYYSYHLIVLT